MKFVENGAMVKTVKLSERNLIELLDLLRQERARRAGGRNPRIPCLTKVTEDYFILTVIAETDQEHYK